jgi:thiamine-monophosphate kinase
MAHWARHFGCPLAGGDIATTPGPLALTLTILGRPHPARGPVLRSAARPGDHLYVTGRLGASLASGRHLSFDPRLAEAHALATTLGKRLHAMIDLSDGLGIDASRVALASGVRFEINALDIPRHDDCDDWHAAASDGEDYELLFTSPAPPDEVQHALADTHTPVVRVGNVREGEGCVLLDDQGAAHDASGLGWDHGAR